MHRRPFLLTGTLLPILLTFSGTARAHHGWSSFDQDRPVYLEGKVSKVKWQNPHVELSLDIAPGMKLPADLASRPLPAQIAPVEGKALLSKAVTPKRSDKVWEIELAPLTRVEAWKVPEIKPGTSVALMGYTFKDEKGEAILRAEYLWLNGKTYALRSNPA
jgi:Family of unknown function (DUF6152)